MKIYVWTSYRGYPEKKPKCIYVGEIDILPRIGESVVCRDGHASETVRSVSIDLFRKYAEITVETSDLENDYGTCLVTG